jgi:hypothetical protein
MKKMLLVMALVLFAGCAEDGSPLFEEDAGVDGGDSDSDIDSDSDADSDTDTDEVYDTDCADGCTDPPPDTCDEEGNLFEYTGSSSCIEDACEYEYETIACGYECIEAPGDDYCMDSICDGVVCDDPPDNECYPESIPALRIWVEGTGECDLDTGECVFLEDIENCPSECIVVSGADDYCA